MYTLCFTEEELAVILQALGHYQYNNPYITQEQFDIAENAQNQIDKIL